MSIVPNKFSFSKIISPYIHNSSGMSFQESFVPPEYENVPFLPHVLVPHQQCGKTINWGGISLIVSEGKMFTQVASIFPGANPIKEWTSIKFLDSIKAKCIFKCSTIVTWIELECHQRI